MKSIAAGHGKGFAVELLEAFGKRSVYVNGECFTTPTPNHDKATADYIKYLRQYTGIVEQ